MQCPGCSKEMTTQNYAGVALEVCTTNCGGIWFDHREFKKFDEPHEAAGSDLLDLSPKLKSIQAKTKRHCPTCANTILMRRFTSANAQVEIDECANCGGIFLDAGELRQIRSEFSTEGERQQAAAKMASQLFGTQLIEESKKSQEALAGARRFANMLRFICPSYYLKGKQDWGAF